MTSHPTSADLSVEEDGFRCLKFIALGIRCTIKYHLSADREAAEFAREVLAWFGAFEAKISRFQPDSTISRINAAAGLAWIQVDAEMERMLDIADEFHYQSNGILDPTMLPLLRVWDWRSMHLALPQDSEIHAALDLTGWHLVERRPGAVRLPKTGMGLDFGYFGKEFAVDHIARIALRRGISDALIDLGRDLFALGGNGRRPYWRIGIEDGANPGTCRGGLSVSDLAVSTSGDFARYFVHDGVRYGHILDPRTGWPVKNGMRAVTVVAPSCLKAGMYGTAAYILGQREATRMAALARNLDVYIQHQTDTKQGPGMNPTPVRQDRGIFFDAPPAIGPDRRLRELPWLTRRSTASASRLSESAAP